MYVVILSLWILVSCMSIMCGSVCNVRVRSCMPGRRELMHPVFQVIIFRVVAWWLVPLVLLVGVWLMFFEFVLG